MTKEHLKSGHGSSWDSTHLQRSLVGGSSTDGKIFLVPSDFHPPNFMIPQSPDTTIFHLVPNLC